jgi:hypothetical protein
MTPDDHRTAVRELSVLAATLDNRGSPAAANICRRAARAITELLAERPPPPRICRICAHPISDPRRPNYCSSDCAQEASRRRQRLNPGPAHTRPKIGEQ